MPFIGNQPALSYTSFAKQDFTTSATTSYTLDHPVTNENEIALFINFVRQEPTTAYTASGTSLTLTSATSASDDMYCVFLGKAVQTVNPPSGSVGLSQLSATGTKDSTTFLRGDNTFAAAGVNGISSSADATAITIDSNENVGIGTTSPGSLLELKHGTNLRLMFDTSIDSLPTIKSFQDTAGRNGLRFDADNINFETNTGTNTPINRLKIASNGEVAVNDDSNNHGNTVFKIKGSQNATAFILQQGNTSGTRTMILFRDGDVTTQGSITCDTSANTTSYNTSSDYRLKENVNYNFDATTRLKQLKPARFNFISDVDENGNPNKTVDGFLAHEVQSVVPEAVTGTKDEVETYTDENGNEQTRAIIQGIDQSKLVPLLVKTIQELEERITALENA